MNLFNIKSWFNKPQEQQPKRFLEAEIEAEIEAEAGYTLVIEPPVSSAVMTSKLPKKKPYTLGGLRNNRWVMVEGKVGIVTSFEPSLSTVDFVDADGQTTHTLRIPTGIISLAKWRDIPEARLVGLTEADALRLGYQLS